MTIAILGTGKMGGTLGRLFAKHGHQVVYGSRTPTTTAEKFADADNITVTGLQQAVDTADTLILAIPWMSMLDTLNDLTNFAGKTVIDLSMPMTADISSLATGIDVSAAEEVAKALPGAKVVKSFTIHADNLSRPQYYGEQAQLFYCGDDPAAKQVVAGLIADLGFIPVDVGQLSNARWIDSLGMLWIQLAFVEDLGMDFGFKLVKG